MFEVRSVVKHYPGAPRLFGRSRPIKAVDGVSFQLQRGATLGIVGESGCGKSTLAKLLVRLERPTSGSVLFKGRDLNHVGGRELTALRRRLQMVFQDPYASLSPRMRASDIVGEGLDLHPDARGAGSRDDRVRELFALVGLSPEHLHRYAHQFSGGQRQRIGIARALALNPELIVLDEPVSALDVSVQAQIVNLLQDLRAGLGLSYVLISHDLSVIGHTCERVAVMYLGRIVELGPVDAILDHPSHPYTQALLSAAPEPDPRRRGQGRRIMLRGDAGDAADPPSGCSFRTRCWKAQPICAEVRPKLEPRPTPGAFAACHFAEEMEGV